MADPRLDAKMEYLLGHYFLTKSNGHEGRKMFKENDFSDFEEFTLCDKQHLQGMRTSKNNIMKGFTDLKITLIQDVLLYYHFLYADKMKNLAKELRNGV